MSQYPHLIGIHKFLATTSMWVTAGVMLVFAVAVIWVLRRVSAGEWYNVTYSGQIGDMALTALVLLGVGVLREVSMPLPNWIGGNAGQFALLFVCYAIGLSLLEKHIMTMQLPEILHGFLIVPVLLYLVVTTILVTVATGMWGILAIEVALLVLWMFLVYIDLKTGRADQVAYHARTGECFLFGW